MVDRLRVLLDRPLEPSAARAIVVLASAILLGVAALFILAVSQPDQAPSPKERGASIVPPPAPVEPVGGVDEEGVAPSAADRRQDPQDVEGTAAARRAARALRSHRALQHVPYRLGKLAITLVGARGNRAVLKVTAPSSGAARRGWKAFLRRFEDRGNAYIVQFAAQGDGGTR
jgi:hypothetical protein